MTSVCFIPGVITQFFYVKGLVDKENLSPKWNRDHPVTPPCLKWDIFFKCVFLMKRVNQWMLATSLCRCSQSPSFQVQFFWGVNPSGCQFLSKGPTPSANPFMWRFCEHLVRGEFPAKLFFPVLSKLRFLGGSSTHWKKSHHRLKHLRNNLTGFLSEWDMVMVKAFPQ